jgi:YhcH/YjgK/YiaL family protein
MDQLVKNGTPVFKSQHLNDFIKQNIGIALSLEVGEYQKNNLSDEFFIIPQNTLLKTSQECIYESHKKFYDIHCCIKGMEQIELLSIADVGDPCEINIESDYCLYRTNKPARKISLSQNQFVIFSFADVHKVGISANGNLNSIVKIVIKIKKDLFEKEFKNV